MIEHHAPQGSQEWRQARAGVITASHFKTICTKVNGLTEQQAIYFRAIRAGKSKAEAQQEAGYKNPPSSTTLQRALDGESVGEFSDAAKNLAFRLAIERISGVPLDEGFTTWAMERGHELEPLARIKHVGLVGDDVREVGFVTTDDGWFGASADGFRAADTIGAEYKCFLAPDKLRAILIDGDTSEVIHQIQGGLWLTGLDRWEFGLYCPALESIGRDFTLKVIDRDDDFIEAMEADLVAFRGVVMNYEAQLRSNPDALQAAASAAAAGAATPPWTAEPAAAPAAPAASTPLPEALFG